MSERKPKQEAKPAKQITAEIPAKVAAVIEAQRRQLFKASAIVDMRRYACASQFEGFDPEQLDEVLKIVDDLIDDAACELEQFAGDEAGDDGDVL